MARISVFSREVDLLVSRHLSPKARQRKAAQYARKALADAQETNKRALGVVPPHRQFVDGKAGVALESVNPDHGRIVFTFELADEMLRWIGEQLVVNSPVLTGRYRDSHVLLADGVEVDADGKIPPAQVYTFVNIQPYARKIERGLSDQAPDGVFEVTAALAQRRFGNIARVRFTYRALDIPAERSRAARAAERNSRNPAIVVTLR
jgi:hypothetical protein